MGGAPAAASPTGEGYQARDTTLLQKAGEMLSLRFLTISVSYPVWAPPSLQATEYSKQPYKRRLVTAAYSPKGAAYPRGLQSLDL